MWKRYAGRSLWPSSTSSTPLQRIHSDRDLSTPSSPKAIQQNREAFVYPTANVKLLLVSSFYDLSTSTLAVIQCVRSYGWPYTCPCSYQAWLVQHLPSKAVLISVFSILRGEGVISGYVSVDLSPLWRGWNSPTKYEHPSFETISCYSGTHATFDGWSKAASKFRTHRSIDLENTPTPLRQIWTIVKGSMTASMLCAFLIDSLKSSLESPTLLDNLLETRLFSRILGCNNLLCLRYPWANS